MPCYLSPEQVHGNILGIEEQSAGVDAGAPGAAFGELGAVGTATLRARSKHVGSCEPGLPSSFSQVYRHNFQPGNMTSKSPLRALTGKPVVCTGGLASPADPLVKTTRIVVDRRACLFHHKIVIWMYTETSMLSGWGASFLHYLATHTDRSGSPNFDRLCLRI